MDIDEIRPVTTCCVFFERGFVESVHRPLATPEERILDEPFDGSRPITFLSRLHPADGRILPRMRAIHRAAANPSAPLWIEQQYVLLARDLLGLYQEVHLQVRRLPAARAATRGEIFRRLSRAREFMHANAHEVLTLGEIARAACLSVYHFHRLFSRAFGESPHQYLTRIRLDRVRHLLALQDLPVPAAGRYTRSMQQDFKLKNIGVVMLGVKDLAQSAPFYRDRLGLAVKHQTEGFAFLDCGAVTLCLSEALARATGRLAGATEIVFAVEHVKAAHQALLEKGVSFLIEPRIVTGTSWAANFADPDGHVLSIFGPE